MPTGSGGGIELFSRNHRLEFGDGTEFKLKGLNWFGFETGLYVVHGLWERSIEDLLNFITQHKFNALRIPLSVDGVLNNPNPPSYDYESCYFDGTITSLEALDYLIDRLAERGILVLLDQHRLNTGSISLCYTDDQHDEATVIRFWDTIIARYGDSWNVMGVDLKNEPHGCEWRDWVDFSKRMGNHILGQVPRWLIFVNGVGSKVDPQDRDCPETSCTEGTFWGENLMGECGYPVVFDTAAKREKLVYSPHIYGPSVYGQEYFDDPTFPDNMPDIWDCHFGFLRADTMNPSKNAIVIGEWGGEYTDTNREKDKTWQDAYAQWANATQLPGTFYWCLNENSGDTGGLLGPRKWVDPEPGSAEMGKLDLLASLYPDPTVITTANNGADYCFQDWSVTTAQTYATWSCGGSTTTTTTTTTAPQNGCNRNAAGCLATGPTTGPTGNCNPDLCCSCECTRGNPSSRVCV